MLGAIMVAQSQGLKVEDVHVASFAWERKRHDPRLGPRTPADFEQLESVVAQRWRVMPTSRLREGHSFLPRVAEDTGAHVYVLDPSLGAVGLRRQLRCLSDAIDACAVIVVDVGGDVIARGDEPGLRSPTADGAVLAALPSDLPATVAVLGAGLDGEISDGEFAQATRNARRLGVLTCDRVTVDAAKTILPLLAWHPSEMAGLACLAALGETGQAEVRGGTGASVRLSRRSATIYSFEANWCRARSEIAQALEPTRSLAEMYQAVIDITGRSELDDERRALEGLALCRDEWLDSAALDRLEQSLLEYSEAAVRRGIVLLTMRRVSEILGLSAKPARQLLSFLERRHPSRVRPPVWRVCSARDREPQSSSNCALQRSLETWTP